MIHARQGAYGVMEAFDAAPIERPSGHEVHLHCLAFAPYLQMTERLFEWLSPDERGRAVAFRFASLKQRFVLSHAYVRAVLAGYLARSPRKIDFGKGAHGKPYIATDNRFGSLEFSLAHCDARVVVAVTAKEAVGVDIEQKRSRLDTHGIARRHFAPQEVEALDHASRASVNSHFLRLWTCKEAFLKATGVGLSYPLDSVVIGGLDDEQPIYHSIAPEFGPASSWSLRTWLPEPDICIAVAVCRPDPLRVRIFTSPGSHQAQARRWES
jgi:4'-phosphopantetheinyl transferase